MMSSLEIPRQQWQEFCDQFSRQHRGWISTVGFLDANELQTGPEAETRMGVLADDLPFQGISADFQGHSVKLAISAGALPGHATHWVEDPHQLYLEQTPEGAHQGLTVQSANGARTVVRFRSAALPEELDGIGEPERG